MKEEEITETQVDKWLQDHRKIYYKVIQDPEYRVHSSDADYCDFEEYTFTEPFFERYKVGPGRSSCSWFFTRIELQPSHYCENKYDLYYIVYYSCEDPAIITQRKEIAKMKDELKKQLQTECNKHTHWWK
jgi:hypothetical protein